METNILQDTQRILDLIAKRDLSDDEKKQLIDDTVDNFNSYINPGFLKYRKSFSSDYVAVEWTDSGSKFTCVKDLLQMNPFEELIAQTTEKEMTRSQSFDCSNSGSILFQPQTKIFSVSNAIGSDPARMANFLGYHTLQNKPTQKLETIYENLPESKFNFSPEMSSNFLSNENKDQKTSDKKIISVRGSVSSWNL